MEVVVLGGSGTFPRPGGACNGFLVSEGETKVLIDIGTGVLSRLYTWADPGSLAALILTHLHPDHFLDIYPFRYFLEFMAGGSLPLTVYAPVGAAQHIRGLFNEPDTTKFDRVFKFVDMAPDSRFAIGPFSMTPRKVFHLDPTYGIDVEAGGSRVFFTSDTAYDPRLTDYARGADVLLAETTLRAKDGGGGIAHMTTTEVARLATEANVRRVVLTHLWPHFDRRLIKREVEAGFDGRIDLAEEGLLIKT